MVDQENPAPESSPRRGCQRVVRTECLIPSSGCNGSASGRGAVGGTGNWSLSRGRALTGSARADPRETLRESLDSRPGQLQTKRILSERVIEVPLIKSKRVSDGTALSRSTSSDSALGLLCSLEHHRGSFRVLLLLRTREMTTTYEIRKCLPIGQRTLSGALSVLCGLGLIETRPPMPFPHSRARGYRLSAKGQRLLATPMEMWDPLTSAWRWHSNA